MRNASTEQRLRELGIELPVPPKAVGAYVTVIRTGNLVVTSGGASVASFVASPRGGPGRGPGRTFLKSCNKNLSVPLDKAAWPDYTYCLLHFNTKRHRIGLAGTGRDGP